MGALVYNHDTISAGVETRLVPIFPARVCQEVLRHMTYFMTAPMSRHKSELLTCGASNSASQLRVQHEGKRLDCELRK